ncbi:mechanosensitive ion channel family protein [Microscilla marina]|uniref:Transporter, small conductance mechanosensitive ion channel (MscS) family n=1 Tax=Microscilla marina ATCC 23134 TaxID=313606 RepID=A1ZRY9_MICM2|nr:mechanosensitive ion channel family protein [Microscilla marina]EAY26877.1 transporter, small conductance mechanosensitive ion channel (MscS) family [Microscilla marina ATCC 23134]
MELSTFYSLLMIAGFYAMVVVILYIMWSIAQKLKVPQKSKRIVFLFFILLGLAVASPLREIWFTLFRNMNIYPPYAGKVVEDSFGMFPWLTGAYLINSLLNYFLWNGALVNEDGERVVPLLLIHLASGLVFFLAGLCIVVFVYGANLSIWLATSGFAGSVAVYLGKVPLNKAFTALSLNLNRQIRKGDFIELENQAGFVQEIGWKSIKLLTLGANQLTIPNTTFVESNVINYSRPSKIKTVTMQVLITGNLSPHEVEKLLIRSALDSDWVLREPTPLITLNNFSKTSATYTIEVSTDYDIMEHVKSHVLSSVWHMLRRKGLYPMPDKGVINNPVEKAIYLMNSVEVLEPFTEEEDLEIAKKAKWQRYGPPERIVIEGEKDNSLYLVAEGRLEVLVRQKDGKNLKVAELGKGSFFGERALLTGEERKATVRALTDVLLCEISKDIIKPLLDDRQNILSQMSKILAKREIENIKKSREYAQEVEEKEKDTVARRLLDLMKNFFKNDNVDDDDDDDLDKDAHKKMTI